MVTSNQKPDSRIRVLPAVELERHEAKYIIHPDQVEPIRDFIRPFCVNDPNATGEIPEYTITTLQLDSEELALYRAKEVEALHRFKLRVRTYGNEGECPLFLEIKRKIRGVINKSRATVSWDHWGRDMCLAVDPSITFRSHTEEAHYFNFVRLTQQIGARPVMLIQYDRESYLSRADNYARVTFDRGVRYHPMQEWRLFPKKDRWWSMDSQTALNREYPGIILELKTFSDCPQWMVDMTRKFDLVRIGFCKYFTAVRMESLFTGAAYSDAAENCTYG
jgi:hypothetical protein